MADEGQGTTQVAKEQNDSLKAIAHPFRTVLQKEGEATDTYRFVLRGNKGNHFYGLFGCQAERVAREFLHSTSMVMQFGSTEKPFPAVAIREQLFLEMARELVLNRGMKLELWERDADDRTFECIVRASPGRLEQFETRFGSFACDGTAREWGCVAAVAWKPTPDGRVDFAVAYVNTLLRVIGFSTFSDSSQCTNLEALLLQVGAREVLFPPPKGDKPDPFQTKALDVLQKLHISREYLKPQFYQGSGVEAHLDLLLRDGAEKVEALSLPSVQGVLGAVIGFLELARDPCNEQQYRMRKVDLSKYMRLDAAAVSALNLLQSDSAVAHRGKTSILSFLDECKTGLGTRLLRVWLTQPLLDEKELSRRHDFVQAFVNDPMLLEAIQGHLRHVPDVDKIVKRLQRKKASLSDCVKLGKFVQVVPRISEALAGFAMGDNEAGLKERANEVVKQMTAVTESITNLGDLFEQSLEEDKVDHTLRMSHTFDGDLEVLAQNKAEVVKEMNKEYRRIMDQNSFTDKHLQLQKHPTHGMALRTTKAHVGMVSRAKDLTKLGQLGGATWFVSAGITRTNNKLKDVNAQYEERQKDLVMMLMDTVATYTEPLDIAVSLVAEIDVLTAFAGVVVSEDRKGRRWSRPQVVASVEGQAPVLEVKAARHPLVEHQLHMLGDNKAFIANDLSLGGNGARLALITGPNMGGKSTFIRTSGVSVLLAQVGMFVPAESMRFSMCDAILARLGAADCMSRGVSTFMAEMLETAAILATATSRSFVLVDELGRGTSTHDGFGLAWGISEHIAVKIGCRCLFATHFHELTEMAALRPEVCNLHVTANTDSESLKMEYKVEHGSCNKSFGINVAQMTKFPEPVVNLARRKASELEEAEERARKRARTENNDDSHNLVTSFLSNWLKEVRDAVESKTGSAKLQELRQQFDSKAAELPPLRDVLMEV
eukprot:Hpha_TRINITY_DN16294_c2_g11::TRINITY_DN16294_c2_g11_i1::g.12353::m.12353/K08735/MSH2; DNA mismatch repair protein MSH2